MVVAVNTEVVADWQWLGLAVVVLGIVIQGLEVVASEDLLVVTAVNRRRRIVVARCVVGCVEERVEIIVKKSKESLIV